MPSPLIRWTPSPMSPGAIWRASSIEELDRLPEKYRAPVVLCLLGGLTRDEAAEQIGYSLNTLKRRLEAGRLLLRERLLRRGIAPIVLAAGVLDADGLRAAVPDRLIECAARSAATHPSELGRAGVAHSRAGARRLRRDRRGRAWRDEPAGHRAAGRKDRINAGAPTGEG